MPSDTRRGRDGGSDRPRARRETAKSLPKPHKRPSQDRSKFTVEAIYDAYVRIWRRDGPRAVTTRAVALESGFAVGTIYGYFPNKTALYSGYVRHTLDWLLDRIERDVIGVTFTDWRTSLDRLVDITCGAEPDQPYFDAEMLDLVAAVAEPKHHRRVFAELCEIWARAVDRWPAPAPAPGPATIEALVLAIWGARRYALLLDPEDGRSREWIEEIRRACRSALASSENWAGAS